MVTSVESYLCESVLVEKTLAEPGAPVQALRGCSQCVPVMGVTERPVNVTPQGGVSAEATCEPPPCGRSIRLGPPVRSAEGSNAVIPSGYFGAWRCHAETMAFIQTR